MEKQEIRIEVSRERVLTRVRMATAYASVRGVGEAGEEALKGDEEMLDILYDSAKASLTATLAGYGFAAEGDVWVGELGAGKCAGGVDTMRVILEDWLVARVMRSWYGLLRLEPPAGDAGSNVDSDDTALITRGVETLLPEAGYDDETSRRRGKRPGARLRLDPR